MQAYQRLLRLTAILAVLMSIGLPQPAPAAEPLRMVYPEDGALHQAPGHFVYDFLRAAEMVVADSGVSVQWVPMPLLRIAHALQSREANFCVAGAGITPDRAALGKFTAPFFADRLLAVVARRDHAVPLAKAHDFGELASHSTLHFLGLTGLNYGTAFTAELSQTPAHLSFAAHSITQLLDMIRGGRADYGVVTRTATENVLAQRDDADLFLLTSYPDMRRDFATAFLCSQSVPDAVIKQLNDAIARDLPQIRMRFPDQAG